MSRLKTGIAVSVLIPHAALQRDILIIISRLRILNIAYFEHIRTGALTQMKCYPLHIQIGIAVYVKTVFQRVGTRLDLNSVRRSLRRIRTRKVQGLLHCVISSPLSDIFARHLHNHLICPGHIHSEGCSLRYHLRTALLLRAKRCAFPRLHRWFVCLCVPHRCYRKFRHILRCSQRNTA